jgi:enoyl-CoA hydratase/carnithine racemase
MQDSELVLVEMRNEVAIVRLNRPRAMNAIDAGLRSALKDLLYALDADTGVHAVVLTGSGERAFCSGQDLDEAASIDTLTLASWLNQQHAMYQAVRDTNKPIVAALNGTAVGRLSNRAHVRPARGTPRVAHGPA